MEINKSKIKDWLLNGWEHDFLSGDDGNTEQEAVSYVCDYLLEDAVNPSKELRSKVEEMITHWINNSDNDRLRITMDLSGDYSLVEEYIKKFIK